MDFHLGNSWLCREHSVKSSCIFPKPQSPNSTVCNYGASTVSISKGEPVEESLSVQVVDFPVPFSFPLQWATHLITYEHKPTQSNQWCYVRITAIYRTESGHCTPGKLVFLLITGITFYCKKRIYTKMKPLQTVQEGHKIHLQSDFKGTFGFNVGKRIKEDLRVIIGSVFTSSH